MRNFIACMLVLLVVLSVPAYAGGHCVVNAAQFQTFAQPVTVSAGVYAAPIQVAAPVAVAAPVTYAAPQFTVAAPVAVAVPFAQAAVCTSNCAVNVAQPFAVAKVKGRPVRTRSVAKTRVR